MCKRCDRLNSRTHRSARAGAVGRGDGRSGDSRSYRGADWLFAAGIIGAAGNEIVAVYRLRVGRRIGSAALVAEGHHARVDGLTSVAVVAGVIGVWAGYPRADAVVGLVIAAVVLGILAASCRTIFRRLMDGVEPGTVERIQAVASAVHGVEHIDRVRARWSGHRLEAHLDVAVAAELSIAQAHHISRTTETALRALVAHLDHAVVDLRPAADS